MADAKPWEVEYEEPKPWEVSYEKPEETSPVSVPDDAYTKVLISQGGPQTTAQFMPDYMKERERVGTASAVKDLATEAAISGKALVAGVSDIGNVFFRPVTEQLYPEQAESGQMPLENIRALVESKGRGQLPSENLESLPAPAQIVGRASQGLIESAPKLAAVTAMQATGVPAPIAAGLVFGATPEGFDPKQAAIAALLPFVGKYSGAMTEALASKLGVSKDVALNIFNKLGGATGAAGYLKLIDESEIAKLPPEQRDKARIDSWANVASQAALGLMGEREPKTPAAEAAQPKETDARTIETPTTVHGPLREQPVEGKGKVPVKEGGERVQPQAEGGIPKEEVLAPAEQIAKDQGLKFGGEVQGQWQFDVTDPKDGQPIRFNIKAGATPEEVSAKAKSKLQEFSSDLPSGVITEEAMLKMTPEQQFELGHKAGIQYGETLTKESVPDLEKKYSAAKNELMDSLKKGDTKGYGAAFGRMNYYGGALMGATKGEHPISGSNYELYLKQKAAEKLAPKETPKPEPTETVLAARGGTAHGLPAGVPDRGPHYAAELMEASRQLGALVRSRSTLRPGVLGQFVQSKLAGIKQADRIEVGDIRNQATVAHEIGHSLDGILFPEQDFGNSQASLAARVGTGTKKELTQELTKVSELMRGPMTGSAGHVQYRKRATELIADWVSLYLHDPGRAWKLAPKFSAGFAKAVAKNDEVHSLVSQLIAGDVTPRPPNPTLPKALAGITGAPPQGTAPMPGKMPARPILPPPVRERQAAVAAEGLVKDAVRTLESKTQSLRILGENWIKDVPKESDRLDVGAFVEGMGNLSKPGDTIDRVRTRMTPAKEQLVKKYRFRQELQRQEINSYLKDTEEGEYLKFLEDYLPHFYVDSAQKIGAAASRFSKESPHAKQRKLPTLKEATDLGLTPITQDPAVLIQLSGRINWQVATNRKFVAKLKDLKTASGGDVVVPKKDNPGNWPTTDNPLIQRVYARQTPNGLMLWRGGAAIHPDVWRAARQILEAPVSGDIGKAYDAINSFTRANAFAFSLFHDLTLRSAAIGSQATAKNPLRGLFRVMEQHPLTGELKIFQSTRGLGKELLQNEEAVADAAQHGLKFSYTDSEAYQHNARTFLERRAAAWRDVPVLGKATRLARDLQQWRQEGLWKNTHDAFKIITYHDLVSKALQDAPPGTDTKAVKEQIASYLNDAYGGQEWQTKFWLDPGTRKVVSRFFLAPDWTLSTIRSVPGISDVASTVREQAPRIAGREALPTQKEGLGGAGRRLRFWGSEIAALAMATAAAQYAIYKTFGDDKKGDKAFPWDNELNQKMRIDVTPLMRKFPWHDPKDPTRHYVNLGKRPQEILNWFTEPDKQVMSKASRPVAIIFEQVTGSEGDFKAPWKQDHESFIESVGSRAKAIGTEALPFTFRGNQFALSAPVRKGMTKYKAQQAYESVFELATNPSRIRSLLRGQSPSEGTIPEMASQITDAAHRNGVPAEEVMVRALSTVRGHHYNEFFKAFQKGNQKKMDEEAKALLVLGATDKGIEESLKRRMELQPKAP